MQPLSRIGFRICHIMRMSGEEQLPENLFMPQILLLRQAGARAMPPLSEVG
jgi:hypothetical protein